MKQQSALPRYIFKIHSERLRKARWKLQLPLVEARKNDEIIALADSQVLRWLDELNGIDNADERAAVIRREIRELRHGENTADNRRAIKKLYQKLDAIQFKADYMCLIIDKEKDYWRACDGFSINGIEYRRLLGTNGGIKNSTIVFISARHIDEIRRRIDNGRDMNQKLVPAKLEAYKALACSASVPVSWPKGILVVKDFETTFREDTIFLTDENDGEPIMELRPNTEITMDASDGFGLMMPSLAERWSKELGLDYIMSGCNTRLSFEKGMIFTFDFQDFAAKVAGCGGGSTGGDGADGGSVDEGSADGGSACGEDDNGRNEGDDSGVRSWKVTDVWGEKHDIRDIELIFTESMLKLYDGYRSIGHYLDCCNENGYTICVTKVTPKELENQRTLNYQFIQSYHLSDDDIEELISPTVEEINGVLGLDWAKTVLFLEGPGIGQSDLEALRPGLGKAIMADRRILDDTFVRSSIYQLIRNRINEAKVGVLNVHGNYSIVSGDPYALCQSIFGLEVTGLLKPGEIYNRYWSDCAAAKKCEWRRYDAEGTAGVFGNDRTACGADDGGSANGAADGHGEAAADGGVFGAELGACVTDMVTDDAWMHGPGCDGGVGGAVTCGNGMTSGGNGCQNEGRADGERVVNEDGVGYDELVCFRAPMSVHNNIRRVRVCQSDEAAYWYRYNTTGTILNSWDLITAALNGCDFDGDMVMLTDNPVLLRRHVKTPAIMCVQRKAEKVVPTLEDTVKSNIAAFGDEIGKTTNWVTSMYEVQARFREGSREYEELEYRTKVGQLIQQNVIDKAKGIVAKPMERSWHDRHAANQIADEAKQRFYRSIVADRKPYFMRYIYPDLMRNYKDYRKKTDGAALREFKMTVDELRVIPRSELTERQKDFLRYYELGMPVGMGDCVMNRICRRFEEIFDGYVGKYSQGETAAAFDPDIMKSGAPYTQRQYYEVKRLYEEYASKQRRFVLYTSISSLEDEELVASMNALFQEFVRQCRELCQSDAALCDIMIDLLYKRSTTKRLLWMVCGEAIVEALLEKNGRVMAVPVQADDGEVSYGGNTYMIDYRMIGKTEGYNEYCTE